MDDDGQAAGVGDAMKAMPGRRLYRWLETLVDEETFQSVVTPVFADLDHEVHAADGRTARLVAHLRCYTALLRVCASGGGSWRTPVKRFITTLGLSAAGAGAALWAIRERSDNVLMMVFLGMGILVPVMLRALDAGRSFRHVLQSCLTVGLFMTATLLVYMQPRQGAIAFLRAGAVFACVAMSYVFIALAASRREPERESVVHRSAVALAFGALCSVVVGTAARLVLGNARFSGLHVVSGEAVRALVFATAAAIFLVPIVLVIRKGVRHRWLLALLSGVAFPIPLFGVLVVAMDGNIGRIVSRFDPFVFTPFDLPYVVACAAIGWMLSVRSESPA
jgi:hypothetical protein